MTILLTVIFGLFVANIISMISDIRSTESKISDLGEEIREQRIINSQYESLLDESNMEDFYVSIAEDELNYAYSDEILYVDVSGQ